MGTEPLKDERRGIVDVIVPDLNVPPRTCDHCELDFAPERVTPVLLTGAQSYLGHLLPLAGTRAVYLCTAQCFPSLTEAAKTIRGMDVTVDEARVKARGRLPVIRELTGDEEMDLAERRCDGIGVCLDADGESRDLLTHEVVDSNGHETAYCLCHAERAYLFDLRRWRDRQAHVG